MHWDEVYAVTVLGANGLHGIASGRDANGCLLSAVGAAAARIRY